MNELKNIPLEELSKAINPFHVNSCKFDYGQIAGAYPSVIASEMISHYNQQTEEYITEQLISFNIDKDVLIKQTEELNRLNSKIRDICNEARAEAIDKFAEAMIELSNKRRMHDIYQDDIEDIATKIKGA